MLNKYLYLKFKVFKLNIDPNCMVFVSTSIKTELLSPIILEKDSKRYIAIQLLKPLKCNVFFKLPPVVHLSRAPGRGVDRLRDCEASPK